MQAQRPALLLHGRDLGGSIEDVTRAVAAVTDGPGPVLLVDGYELLTRLDRWFREHLLPSLPADSVVVLAGREPPVTAWISDFGDMLTTVPLANLAAADADALLRREGLSEADAARITRFTQPLPKPATSRALPAVCCQTAEYAGLTGSRQALRQPF